MARVTATEVEAIIEVDETIGSLTPFIEVANNLVTRVCLASSYEDDTLALIEKWLAAHFYAIRDPRITSQSVSGGGAGVTSNQPISIGLGLDQTTYGQQAKIIDTAGNLALLDMRMKKGYKTTGWGITWLGTPPPDQVVPETE